MLRQIPLPESGGVHRVRGDGVAPPFARNVFAEVAVLGNAVGFSGVDAERFLEALESLVAPGGTLLLEVVAGPGERSRYLRRLPEGAVARLLRAPVRALCVRVEREGFEPEPPRKREEGEFRRFDPEELAGGFRGRGWTVDEIVAVAPALGASPYVAEAVRHDPKAWVHVLELEETLGRSPRRWAMAAAVLLALSSPPTPNRTVK
jgi:hypothetical protein